MAHLELSYADHAELKSQGRNFNCAKCPIATQKARRCHEPRWDFDEKDDPMIFPLYIHKGGNLYGFCPAKATWDGESRWLYSTLTVAADTGAMLTQGGIEDQPAWFVELLAWFLPVYDQIKFASKARMVLGDGKDKGRKNGNNQRSTGGKSKR